MLKWCVAAVHRMIRPAAMHRRFQWLQRMLDHEISEDAAHLEGPYAKAFDRICNQVFFAMGVLQAGMKPYRNEQSQAL